MLPEYNDIEKHKNINYNYSNEGAKVCVCSPDQNGKVEIAPLASNGTICFQFCDAK